MGTRQSQGAATLHSSCHLEVFLRRRNPHRVFEPLVDSPAPSGSALGISKSPALHLVGSSFRVHSLSAWRSPLRLGDLAAQRAFLQEPNCLLSMTARALSSPASNPRLQRTRV